MDAELEPLWQRDQATHRAGVAAAASYLSSVKQQNSFRHTSRVTQLDANLLDLELENVLSEPFLKSLKLFNVCLILFLTASI